MTEISSPETEVISRLEVLLAACNSEHETTEAFSHCSSIVLWAVQLLERPREGARSRGVKEKLKKTHFVTYFELNINKNTGWSGEFDGDQIDPDCSYSVLKSIRDCFAHVGEHRIAPQNRNGDLKEYRLYLGGRAQNGSQWRRPEDFRYFIDFDRAGFVKLGSKTAKLIVDETVSIRTSGT